jgi:hypothetical protein
MAKTDNVSFLERHVEKVVLAVCLLLLGAAAFHWLLASAVSMTVIGRGGKARIQNVSPGEVDEILSEAAQSVRQTWDEASIPVKAVPKYAGRTQSLLPIRLAQREEVDLALPGLPLHMERIEHAGPTTVRLEDVVAAMPVPPKPIVEGYTELPRKKVSTGLEDVRVARGVDIYPVQELADAWNKVLAPVIPILQTVRVVGHGVVVEVQELLPGGQWSPARTVTCEVAPKVDEQGKTVQQPVIPDFDGKNYQIVRDTRDALGQSLWQEHVVRPEYYQIYLAGRGGWVDWRVHLPKAMPQAGQAAVWFHDDKTMKVGRTYRYRVSLAFVNPLLSYEDAVSKKSVADARQKLVETKPSEWSDPMVTRRDVDFFLTGAGRTTGNLTVTVFAYKWGQRVQETFRIKPGDPIGGKKKVQLHYPLGQPGEKRGVEVDYSTGAVSLRFDFGKVLWRKGTVTVRTSELLYIDKDGKLNCRIQALDEDNPLRNKLAEEVKQAR